MRQIAAAALCVALSACQHVDQSDCRHVYRTAPYNSLDLSPQERDSLELGGEAAAFASGWACGFGDGVRSRELVIDLP